jgi:hypothetical protein
MEEKHPAADSLISKEFEWITNDALLRDEGIIFGLGNGDADQKVSTIQYYYEELTQSLKTRIQSLEESISGVNDQLTELTKKNQFDETEYRELLPKPTTTEHSFWRIAFGFLAYSLVLVLSFSLIYFWFDGDWTYQTFISLGLYVFGTLLLFNEKSILFPGQEKDADTSQKWLRLLEELGVPLVVTTFIIIWGYDGEPFAQTASLAMLLFVLFLFGGKGFLSSFEKLRRQFQLLMIEKNERRWKQKRLKQLQGSLESYSVQVDSLQEKSKVLLDQLNHQKMELSGLSDKCKAKIALFLSEYELASKASRVLDEDQMYILTNRNY